MQPTLTSGDIARLRLANQQISATRFTRPADLLQYMGCIQAQDYAMSKWALGCRLQDPSDTAIEKDFNEGKILRTHVLRPTWHFICPADIRWMLKLTAPKTKALSKPYHQKLSIDQAVLRQSKKIITKALTGHKRLTREALTQELHKGKVDVSANKAGFLLMDAELDALICSAGREGKKFCYRLLDEPPHPSDDYTHDEALAELARRYFLSRGPATIQDFCWWTGLTLTEGKRGLEIIKHTLQQVIANGNTHWLTKASLSLLQEPPAPAIHLLPAFDEYTIAYTNRDEVLDPQFGPQSFFGLKPAIVQNGRVIGLWRRIEKKDSILIEATPFKSSGAKSARRSSSQPNARLPNARLLNAASKKYAAFMKKKSEPVFIGS